MHMQVRVEKTSIFSIPVDAVVNPANSLGTMEAGVSQALRLRGGESIQAEAMSSAPIAVGAAVITQAGALPARHVIHVPTMAEPGAKVAVEHIRRAARAALLAAHIKEFQVVAFPVMGTGDGAVDAVEAARAIVEELRSHRRAYPEVVYLVDTSQEMIDAFEMALQNVQLGI